MSAVSRGDLLQNHILWQSDYYSEPMMSAKIEILEAEALQLSPSERARLIERLIISLDIDPALEEAWAAEVERRNAEIESGAVSLLPGPESLAKLKAEFQ
jgi:putative addiction module component (TIGR02574 family)